MPPVGQDKREGAQPSKRVKRGRDGGTGRAGEEGQEVEARRG